MKEPINRWQKIAEQGGKCERCQRVVSHLTVDHIVPSSIIQSLDDTGQLHLTLEENFQFLCYPCNRLKGNRLDKTCPKTKELLIRLLGDNKQGDKEEHGN
jgi:5-methylcytosine-specific restriction endonuclease McrA